VRLANVVSSGLALWIVVGCSSKALDDRGPDGGGGTGSGGAGGGGLPTGDGGLPTGQRSYLVTSTLMRDGGVGSAPASHTFTLILDADRRTAIAGSAVDGGSFSLEQTTSGALHIVGSPSFTIDRNSCSGSSVTYTDLTFTIDANDQLTGTGAGTLHLLQGDVVQSVGATMSLSGAADTRAPTLRISGGFFDPLLPFSVLASEPLPSSVSAVLRAEGGETLALTVDGVAGSFVSLFRKPATTLRYGTQYQVVVDGVTDFAGNVVTDLANLIFFTKPLPPLAPEDGFESVTGTTFAGVSVLSSADGPVIAGTKSLYIPAADRPTSANPAAQPELALRVPVQAGDTTVRFTYRTVKYDSTSSSYGASWALGSVGGTPAAPALPTDTAATTDVSIGGRTWTIGPITTAAFELPAGAAGEIVLQRTFTAPANLCGFWPPAVNGIIIDDLRVE
jgi:hypothetical protein